MSLSSSSIKSLLILSLLFVSTFVGDAGSNEWNETTGDIIPYKVQFHLGLPHRKPRFGRVSLGVKKKGSNKRNRKSKRAKSKKLGIGIGVGVGAEIGIPGNQGPNPGAQDPKPNPGNQDPKPNLGAKVPNPGNQDPKPNPSLENQGPNPNPGNQGPNPGNQGPKPNPGNQGPNPGPQDPKPNPGGQVPNPVNQNPKPKPNLGNQGPNPNLGNQGPNPGNQGPNPNPGNQGPMRPGVVAETNFLGAWELVNLNSGVSGMHLQLLPTNKLIMFDATSLGKSDIQLPPNNCRPIPKTGDMDCYAHSVEYDPEANKVRILKVTTDPWCSSGGLAPDGTLVGTGGWADGEKTIRYINPCDNCDWRESNILLSDVRWYATQTLLGDGRFVVIGGRRAFNYEFLAPEGQPSPGRIDLPFLRDTTDLYENNLYPFVHLAPDGNLFILANNKAILLDVTNNKIVRTYPDMPGGARNYPGSGSSAILTMDLRAQNADYRGMEVLVCGGGDPVAFGKAEKEQVFLPALDTCGRIKVLDPNPQWEMEQMPSPRVMGDMLNLPNGEILIINGAKKGASGWQYAEEPNFTPLLYSPNKAPGQRFKTLVPTLIARMYHSSSAVLPDGRILVAGSNTNPSYQFANVKFPTELRVEKFSPPYLDPNLARLRPLVNQKTVPPTVEHGNWFGIQFMLNAPGPQKEDIMVTLYQPPFTTHGYSMNQRLLSLPINQIAPQGKANYNVMVQAPATTSLAPPGHYLLFLNYQGVPSVASWIKLL